MFQIRNAEKPICADAGPNEHEPIIGYRCHGQGVHQVKY